MIRQATYSIYGLGSGEGVRQPQQLGLLGNYPNPFNPSTKIVYSITNPSDIELIVYDTSGRQIKIKYLGIQTAGQHEFIFDGSDLVSGLYYYTINSTRAIFSEQQTGKMLLTK